MSGFLVLERLSRRFANGSGVADLSLSIAEGEILALLGPSGSGKTTTLRMLAGFEQPDAGRILVGGDDLTPVPPVRRRIGMVFQHYALFPHLTVGGNVAFGLEGGTLSKADLATRVAGALAAVDLAGYEDRAIGSLSGGQQQRVALARALAPEPRILLLDEPLSNLDPALRERTRHELRRLIQRIGITTVLVTHEQEEAFDLADRIAVLNAGRLDQLGTAESLYHTPATAFVAGFIGRASRFEGEARSTGAGTSIEPGKGLPSINLTDSGLTGPVTVACRPEAFRLAPVGTGRWQGRVIAHRFIGPGALYRVTLEPAGPAIEVQGPAAAAKDGDAVGIEPTGVGVHVFPGTAR